MSQGITGRPWLRAAAAVGLALSPLGLAPAGARTYDTVLTGVKEVCLVGTADRAYWDSQMAAEGLYPTVRQGRAEVTICGMVSRWAGIRFREGTVVVSTSAKPGGHLRDGYFLVHGANSNPVFAWVERTVNRAPYAHGNVLPLLEATRTGFSWEEGGKQLIQAMMTAPAIPSGVERDTFEGPIYLPRALSPQQKAGSYVAGKLDGEVTVYPFDPHRDTFRLGSGTQDVVRVLRDSHFTPTTWHVRPQGTHARTNTLER